MRPSLAALGRAADCWGPRWTFVYIVFDDAGECLYVGMTIYVGENGPRWDQHKRDNPKLIAEAAHFRLMGPYTRDVARRIELQQQVLRRPKYNRDRKSLRLIANAQAESS